MESLTIVYIILVILFILIVFNFMTDKPGPKGELGLTGPIGPNGELGLTGPVGPQGEQGLIGLIGPVGQQGEMGLMGPQGEMGPIGLTGPIGPQGEQGLIGPVGPQGEQGIMGLIGATGSIGLTGPIGPQGKQGLTGPIGPQGEQGIMGLVGPAGNYENQFEFKLGSFDNTTQGNTGLSRAFSKSNIDGGSLVINPENDFNGVMVRSSKNPFGVDGNMLVKSSSITDPTSLNIQSMNPASGAIIDFTNNSGSRNIRLQASPGKLNVGGAMQVNGDFASTGKTNTFNQAVNVFGGIYSVLGMSGISKWNSEKLSKDTASGEKNCPDGKYVCGANFNGNNLDNLNCCSFRK
jgi:hypothetical protein